MKNRTIDIGVVAEIAHALGDLNNLVVFVGGAVVSVYADDDAADEVRPTQDIDLTVTILDLDHQQFDNQLAEKGFHLDMQGHAVCSYKYKDIAVDIMPSSDSVRGPTNRWYVVGFDSIESIDAQGISIQILSAPCFLATKFEAYNHRGEGDYRTSHDFEDIIYVIDNRTTIVGEITQADSSVKEFLNEELQKGRIQQASAIHVKVGGQAETMIAFLLTKDEKHNESLYTAYPRATISDIRDE